LELGSTRIRVRLESRGSFIRCSSNFWVLSLGFTGQLSQLLAQISKWVRRRGAHFMIVGRFLSTDANGQI
jgi:hypothetical protein